MRNPGGYAQIINPSQSFVCLDDKSRQEQVGCGLTELDSFTCFHCGSIRHVRPKEDPSDTGGLCKCCMKLICSHCVGKGCIPFEKKLEAMESRDRALRSYGF